MYRKLISFFLAVCLLLPASVLAEEDAKTNFTTYFDDGIIESKDPIWMNSYDVYAFAPIARKLGYTVTYDEAENKVVATKGNESIFIVPGDNQAHKYVGDNMYSVRHIGPPTCEFDGTFYMSSYGFRMLFNLSVSTEPENKSIHIISSDYVKRVLDEHAKPTKKLFDEQFLFPNCRSDLSFQADFLGKSDLFGIHLNGASKGNVTVQKQDRQIVAKIKIDNSGVYNFYNLILAFMTPEVEEKVPNTLGKSIDISLFLDDENFYINAGELGLTIVEAYIANYYYYEEDKLKKCHDLIKDKWICFPLTEAQKFRAEFLLSRKGLSYENCVEALASEIFYSDFRLTNEKVLSQINQIVSLWNGSNLTFQDTDGKSEITYTLNETGLKQFTFGESELLPYQQQLFDNLSFHLNFNATTDKKTTAAQTAALKVNLKNIPNDFNLDCGNLSATFSLDNIVKEGTQNISKPQDSECVTYSVLYELLQTSEE